MSAKVASEKRAQTNNSVALHPRKTFHRIATGLIAILTAFFGLPLTAAPAQAGLFNVMPTDIDGNPNYDFTTADALFVYATSDIRGGRVCVVDASIENPADASCDSPAWGSTNNIVTIGSYFGPLEAPPLTPGNWKLLAENSDHQPTMLSEIFTVTVCNDCSTEVGMAAVQAWKDAAAGSRYGATGYCALVTIKSAVDDAASADTTDLPGGSGSDHA